MIVGWTRNWADEDVASVNNWRDLLDELEIIGGELQPVTAEDLDGCEARIGFALPQSYRDFMSTFGPGELFEKLRIASPRPVTDYDPNGRLESDRHGFDATLFEGAEAEIAARLFPFGYDVTSNVPLLWEVDGESARQVGEYATYIDTRQHELVQIGETLYEVVARARHIAREIANEIVESGEEEFSVENFRPSSS